jgi:hypothetical protein
VTIQVLVVSLLAVLGGLSICFVGYRLFLVLLPLWGLVTGFMAGASAVTLLFGDGFLSTVLGWGAGIAVGLVFAAFAYLYWYGVVIVVGGSIGYLLGVGLLGLVGIGGPIAFLAGVALGVVFAIVVAVLNLPKYVVVVASALFGANLVVAGVGMGTQLQTSRSVDVELRREFEQRHGAGG